MSKSGARSPFSPHIRAFGWEGGRLTGLAFTDDATTVTPGDGNSTKMTLIDTASRDPLTGSLPAHEKAKLMQLLGQWEEPMRVADPSQVRPANC